jgi:hypothetical protein
MAGVVIELHAWPSDTVLHKLRPGQAVPWKLLATAKTSAVGTYTLAVPRAALVSAAVDNGWANLEIDSSAGEHDFSYQTDPAPGHPPAPAVKVDLRAPAKGDHVPDYCITPGSPWVYIRGYFPEPWAVVGQGYVLKQPGTKGDYVTFKYDQGSSQMQTSHLGVGASGYGASAGFSTTGSDTETSSAAEGWDTNFYQQNVWFLTEFSIAEYRMSCEVPEQPKKGQKPVQHGSCPAQYKGIWVIWCVWKIRSTGWFGGASVQFPKNAPSTPYYNCAFQRHGTSFHSDRGKAVEWDSGYQIGANLGIKGVHLKVDYGSTSQTGYDSNAFGFARDGWMCGTNTAPSKAAQLVARDNLPPR